MKKNSLFKKIFLGLLALTLPLFASAQELPRLEVDFDPNPLFSETEIMPGDSVSGTVTVTNNTGEPQTVITEAINVSDTEMLSDSMTLEIRDGDDTIFYDGSDGTFYDFLTNSIHTLSTALPDDTSVVYTYTVSFDISASNDSMYDTFGFDLCVGFFDELSGMNCGDTVVSDEGNTDGDTGITGDGGTTTPGTSSSSNGGGGGGPFSTTNLEIQNERVTAIDDIGGSAMIEWDTNLLSTSQVVYGLADDGPYSLTTLDPSFGYPESSVEDLIKVYNHVVIITGLVPGEEYIYRVVSRASPPTVSYEHSFVVAEEEENEEVVYIPIEDFSTVATVQPTSGGSGSTQNTITTSGGNANAISCLLYTSPSPRDV